MDPREIFSAFNNNLEGSSKNTSSGPLKVMGVETNETKFHGFIKTTF